MTNNSKNKNSQIPNDTSKKPKTFWQKSGFYVKLVVGTLLIWGIYLSGLASETSQVMAVASFIQSINMVLGFGTPLIILYLIYRHNNKK